MALGGHERVFKRMEDKGCLIGILILAYGEQTLLQLLCYLGSLPVL